MNNYIKLFQLQLINKPNNIRTNFNIFHLPNNKLDISLATIIIIEPDINNIINNNTNNIITITIKLNSNSYSYKHNNITIINTSINHNQYIQY